MFIARSRLIYFAFPKCGTKWLQQELKQRGNNRYSPLWDNCDIGFFHIEPVRFLRHYNVCDVSSYTMFTIVRNTYARLVSSWEYGRRVNNSYAKHKTFEDFIAYLYANKDRLRSLPFCWMFLPVHIYFQGVLDRVQFFQLESLDDFITFMEKEGGRKIRNYVVNANKHNPYESYYTPKIKAMVDEMYHYEIEKFSYTLDVST